MGLRTPSKLIADNHVDDGETHFLLRYVAAGNRLKIVSIEKYALSQPLYAVPGVRATKRWQFYGSDILRGKHPNEFAQSFAQQYPKMFAQVKSDAMAMLKKGYWNNEDIGLYIFVIEVHK